MFDEYLIRFIEGFLKKCNFCKKYDINQPLRYCCYCNKFSCSSCKIIRDYTYFETCGFYCEKCHKELFV